MITESLTLAVKGAFGRLGYQIRQTPRRLWEGDAEFEDELARIAGRTLVDPARAFILRQCARQTEAVPGQAAEVGVYRGGTARLLAGALKPGGRILHLFDTFAGMPRTDAGKDVHREGDFADTSLESVRGFLLGFPAVEFHAGFFPETARGLENERFSFVHLDVDIHRSIRDGLEFFYPRLAAGGMIVVDDYGVTSCPGVKTAADAFFAGRKEFPLALPTGQCLIVKLP